MPWSRRSYCVHFDRRAHKLRPARRKVPPSPSGRPFPGAPARSCRPRTHPSTKCRENKDTGPVRKRLQELTPAVNEGGAGKPRWRHGRPAQSRQRALAPRCKLHACPRRSVRHDPSARDRTDPTKREAPASLASMTAERGAEQCRYEVVAVEIGTGGRSRSPIMIACEVHGSREETTPPVFRLS